MNDENEVKPESSKESAKEPRGEPDELRVMRSVLATLMRLTPKARSRVLAWLSSAVNDAESEERPVSDISQSRVVGLE